MPRAAIRLRSGAVGTRLSSSTGPSSASVWIAAGASSHSRTAASRGIAPASQRDTTSPVKRPRISRKGW